MIATQNRAKASRIRALIAEMPFEIVDGSVIANQPDVPESGLSHLANAIEKATAWSHRFSCLAIGSDGGLSIPALGAYWSSLITRRATGADVPDAERAVRLLRRMAHLTGPGRACHWTESLAVADQGWLLGAWEANGLKGEIANEYVSPPTGTQGFWVSGLWTTLSGVRHWEMAAASPENLTDPWLALAAPVRELLYKLGNRNHAIVTNDQSVSH